MRGLIALSCAGLLMGLAPAALPCTGFLLEDGDQRVFGKSYDWSNGLGLVILNKRGVVKTALPSPMSPSAATTPLQWTSRHASVTFNQYGHELPNGGMNDAGLMIEIMWLNDTRWAPPDARRAVNELQWIQYHLDSFRSVDEVIRAARELRIAPIHAKVHYLACDKGGACAAFEVLDGELVITSDLPRKVLTNDPYQKSNAFDAARGAAGGAPGRGSLARFSRAARAVAARSDAPLIDRAFTTLADVSMGAYSKWNIVYDPASLTVHFRTSAQPAVKTVRLSAVDGACSTPAAALDVDTVAGGDVTARFRPLTTETNHALVSESIARLGAPIPAAVQRAVAVYPSTLSCGLAATPTRTRAP